MLGLGNQVDMGILEYSLTTFLPVHSLVCDGTSYTVTLWLKYNISLALNRSFC